VAQAGFTALEFGFPSHADIPALEAARRELGLEIVLFNQDVPVWDGANRGYLVDQRRRAEFERTLSEAIEIGGRLGVQKIMLPSGIEVRGEPREAQLACMRANLRAAASQAERVGVMLTIEVLNPVDNPGYFLTSADEALAVVREVNHPLVRFQLDTYHVTVTGGDPLRLLREHAGWIGHIQFADAPGRHEPGTGTIDFAGVLAAAEQGGYRGYIGLEYIPQAAGAGTLAWVPPNRRRLTH
jgi:hydroxypyruvate isomerase